MIVSGGKILGIHRVEHDLTFSGDGVRTPLGIDHGLLEEIQSTSAKLDKSAFDSWVEQTESWDIDEYTGGDGIRVYDHEISVSAKYLTSGDLQPYATEKWVEDQNYITSAFLGPYAKTQWVQEELDKKQDVSGMSAYATSGWVEDNFLKQADYREYTEGNGYIKIDGYKIYGYDWTSAVSGVPFKLETSAFEQYSGYADRTYLKEDALAPYAQTQWVQEKLAEKQNVSAMSAYATSSWVDQSFQPKGDYITPAELETALEPYAISSQVNEGLAKKVDITAMSAYATSAWVEENFSKETVRVSYDPQTEELHLDFSPAQTDYVLIGDRLYHYVQIGDQLWIDENLDYKFAYDGGTLPIGASEIPSTPAAWYYSNDEATYGVDGNKYGLLYNWYAAKYLEDNKSTLLPEGWHVPSTTDWSALADAVGGASTAGTVLKSTTGWTTGAGTNDYGFNGVPAGCHRDGSPVGLDVYAYFWTSIEYNSKLVYYRSLAASNNSLSSNMNFKTDGYSIRLVKDIT